MLTQVSAFVVMAGPVVLISLWAMHQTVRIFSFRRMTIPGFWYLSYLVIIFMPAFYVAASKPDGSAKSNYLFAVESALLTAPLGVLAMSMILRFRPIEIKPYFIAPIQKRGANLHLVLAYSIFLLGALGLMTLYVIEVGTIPFFYLITNLGAGDEIASLREDSFKLLNSRFTYAYAILSKLGFPFLITLALGYYLNTKRLNWLFLFLIATGSGVLYAAFSAAKAPVAAIFVMVFIFLYLYFGGKIGITWLVPGLILIFIFPIAVILLTYPVGLLIALRAIVLRLFDDPARQLYSYFEVVPQHLDYLHGATISFVAQLRGEPPFDLTNFVALYDNPTLIERGFTSASANAAFIGDLYANFGVSGVLIGGFLAGFLMQLMQIYLIRQPKTVSNLAIYSFLMLSFWFLHFTTLQTTLLSGGVVFVFILAWVIRICATFLRRTGTTSVHRQMSSVP